MKNIEQEDKKEGGAITLEEFAEFDFNEELSEFRRTMPADVERFNADIEGKAFRKLYDWVVGCEPVIDIFDVAEEIIDSLQGKNIEVLETYRDHLIIMLDVMMRFLAGRHGYSKRGVEGCRAEIKRLVWPYVARARGDAGAVDALADVILEYYDTHNEISTAEATSFVWDASPYVLEWDEMNMLLNEVFDFLCENGDLTENT
jgi:hypothetical protein